MVWFLTIPCFSFSKLQAEMDRLIALELDRVQAAADARQARADLQRQRLMQDVLSQRQQQIADKMHQKQLRQEQVMRDLHAVDAEIEQFKRDEAAEEERERQEKLERRAMLEQQMSENQRRQQEHQQQLQREHEERMRQEIAYKQRLEQHRQHLDRTMAQNYGVSHGRVQPTPSTRPW